ncbi:general amidase [Fusarium beomiforme]|uniref:amidase n=1 Tax=Fusarium beomiforme TaxID=44412 RepID=A0A9P5DQW7_9HYPO|nr:general amidase [Fusarium beomiforme]
MASVLQSLPQGLVSQSQPSKSAKTSVLTDWEIQAEKCRTILRESLNQAWLLPAEQLPPADQFNVSTFIETCGFLSSRELDITSTSATILVQQMASGSLTAVETVTAFLKRAHIGHQLTNFATEFMNAEALETAAQLDTYFQSTGKIKGPLHGIPISTKEHIEHKGRIAHSAYVALIDNIAEEDALIVQFCKKAGAVFHVRTNEPQSVMHIDCSNPIYGTTVNPHNRTLTCGGSSGGEGVSLGLRCAALGIGTDVGGSVRVPAAFCGAYGLRTTALRNPYRGVCLPGAGQESIRCVISPLANTAEDLGLFQKAILDQEPWEIETSLVPLPWKQISPPKSGNFTIGVMWEDGLVRPHPPVVRALRYAVDKLKAAGATVVDFEPYKHQEGMDIVSTLYFPECAVTQKDLLAKGGEPVAPLSNVPQSSLSDHLKGLTAELQCWEQLLLDDQDSHVSQYGDSRFKDLVILATSLLLDLIAETLMSRDNADFTSPLAGDGDGKPWRWQLDLAMNILQCPEEHQKWSGCYLGAWPLLIFGYGARSLEEITLVKDVLKRMQQRIGYGEVQRIRDELDEITTYKGSKVWVRQEILG